MHQEISKQHARAAFEGLGFEVEDIPESVVDGAQRADLIATRGSESYVIEAKGKEPHEAYLRLVEQGGGALGRDVKPWRALASVIEKAATQLQATPVGDITARLLWISALHDDWKFVFDAFRMRLLGAVELNCFRMTDSGIPTIEGFKPCYYYYPPDLARFTSIDGVIFAGPRGSQLVLSDFGACSARLRASWLCADARATGSVLDVGERTSNGNALVIFEPNARVSNQKRWEYLTASYDLLTSPVVVSDFRALLQISLENEG